MIRVHRLYYINGRLASNQDLRALYTHEQKYGVRAIKTVSYPKLNVMVVKYTTIW
jgi:hypothetical protein